MIIISQDKKAITDDLKLYIRENDFVRGKVKWEIRNAEQDLLATYSTEEKAIKVLDMIQELYGKFIYGQVGKMATANYYVPPLAFILPKVFHMPSEESVEV